VSVLGTSDSLSGAIWRSALVACCALHISLIEIFEPLLLFMYEIELCEGEPELMTEEAILDWASAAADAPANSTAHQCHDRSASLLAWLRSDD